MRRRYPRICPRCKSRLWKVPKIRPLTLGTGLGIEEVIDPHRGELLRLAWRAGARNVRVFGSVRRREATRDSDVDLLVRWEPGTSLLDVARLRLELGDLLGHRVDLVDEPFLHWALRPQILSEAAPL